MLLAVGGHTGDVAPTMVQLATSFGGGVGGSHQEMCGALSGGMMVIGLLSGRVTADQDSQPCRDLAALFRRRFLARMGATQCERLRQTLVEAPGGWGTCDVLVERAAGILLEVLEEAGYLWDEVS